MKLTKEKRKYISKVIDSCYDNNQCQSTINWLDYLNKKSKRHKDTKFLFKNIYKCIDLRAYYMKLENYKEEETKRTHKA